MQTAKRLWDESLKQFETSFCHYVLDLYKSRFLSFDLLTSPRTLGLRDRATVFKEILTSRAPEERRVGFPYRQKRLQQFHPRLGTSLLAESHNGALCRDTSPGNFCSRTLIDVLYQVPLWLLTVENVPDGTVQSRAGGVPGPKRNKYEKCRLATQRHVKPLVSLLIILL